MQLNLEDHRVVSAIPTIHLVRDYITPEEESYLVRKIDQVGNANAVVKPDQSLSVRAGGWQRVNGRRSMYWGGALTPKGKLVPQSPPAFMTHEWPHVFPRLQQLLLFSDSSSHAAPLPPNHCLVNEYNPGDGILPHVDGPAYLPTVATISLESDTVYEFHCAADRYGKLSARLSGGGETSDEGGAAAGGDDSDGTEAREPAGPIAAEPLFSLFVPRRSLLVLRHMAYSLLLHSIPPRPVDLLHPHLLSCLNWPAFDPPVLPSHCLSLPRTRRISLTCRRVQRVVQGLHQFLK